MSRRTTKQRDNQPMAEVKKTVVHLKQEGGNSVCLKCNANIAEDGVYTYKEEVYNEPPPGYINCKTIWAE